MSEQAQTTILFRHTDGPKKGQTEKFTAAPDMEIRIGRGPTNQVAFDPAIDTISRDHCSIKVNSSVPDTYEITDLKSKNGTYVNGKSITEKIALVAGDIIKLGKEGPTIEFDLDPRPASHIKKTRVLDITSAKETKVFDTGTKANTSSAATPPKETIGKQTMQHMLQESEKKGKKGLLITVASVVVVFATAGFVMFNKKPKPGPQLPPQVINNYIKDSSFKGLTPAQIVKANESKVVFIELGWKLELTATGDQLYHVYLPYKANGSEQYYACYWRNNQGNVEPYLTTKSNAPNGARLSPIGSFGSGSGFVVDERGFIITNRHVAAGWLTSYHFGQDAFPGIMIGNDSKGNLAMEGLNVSEGDVTNWVPAEAMNYNRRNIQSGIKAIDGRLSYLDVTFANNSLRTPAKVVRISDVHDVAMIKIELPETLTKVEMYDDHSTVEVGSPVVVMGYPGMSPDQYVERNSQDAFNTNPNIVKVPVPTLSTGNIGRLVKSAPSSTGARIDGYMSSMGDYYQLTINSTGPGNSGGPMFDDHGRVTGIYSAGSAKMSYAIPIRYAMDLMGRQEVIK
jgi:serine protease Do